MVRAAVAILACSAMYGQGTGYPLSFEVASIRPVAPNSSPAGYHSGCSGGPGTQTPGQFKCSDSNVFALVGRALELKSYQFPYLLADGPRFDLLATVPKGATKEQLSTMLQNLLVERFKLAYHFEKKEMNAFDLLVSKGGPRLTESQANDALSGAAKDDTVVLPQLNGAPRDKYGFPLVSTQPGRVFHLAKAGVGSRLFGRACTIDQIAEVLSVRAGGPVIDATGLKAKYDFVLTFAEEQDAGPALARSLAGDGPVASDPKGLPTLTAALQDQLGLKLQRQRRLVDVLVIDHVERNPSEN